MTGKAPPSTSRRASDIQAHKQHFLWDGRIPENHLTVIAGGSNKGKSTLGYHIFAAVGVPTIFITTEEVDHTVWRPRIEAAGGDLDLAYHHPELLFSRDPEDIEALAELVKKYQAKLVIVDPLSNHLRDSSIYKDEQVRRTLEPYMALMEELDFTILAEVHVLRSVAKNAPPLNAVPAGVHSLAKAVYLFGQHPSPGADPNLRVLACAEKFNFGTDPASLLFEMDTREVKVKDPKTKRWMRSEYAYLEPRGAIGIGARSVMVTLRPEDRERKSDRAAMLLVKLLKHGPMMLTAIRAEMKTQNPPVAWRTVARVAAEMGIETIPDPVDTRKRLWQLPEEMMEIIAEADEDGSDLEIFEVSDAA